MSLIPSMTESGRMIRRNEGLTGALQGVPKRDPGERPPEVVYELEALANEITILVSASEQLSRRLEPVMSQDSPEAPGGIMKDSVLPITDLGKRICEQRCLAMSARRTIESAIRRLEI